MGENSSAPLSANSGCAKRILSQSKWKLRLSWTVCRDWLPHWGLRSIFSELENLLKTARSTFVRLVRRRRFDGGRRVWSTKTRMGRDIPKWCVQSRGSTEFRCSYHLKTIETISMQYEYGQQLWEETLRYYFQGLEYTTMVFRSGTGAEEPLEQKTSHLYKARDTWLRKTPARMW